MQKLREKCVLGRFKGSRLSPWCGVWKGLECSPIAWLCCSPCPQHTPGMSDFSWDVMEVLLPGTGDRLSVMSESQTWLGAGLGQILSYSHDTGWESLWDPHSNHGEAHGITWTK